MKCSKFRKIAVPLLMETEGEDELALVLARRSPKLRRHMDSCEACRGYLLSCRETLGRLGRIEIEQPAESDWERVLAAVHGSEGKKARSYRLLWGGPRLVPWARVAPVAVAALLLLVVGGVYFMPRQAEEVSTTTPLAASVQPAGESSLAFLDEMALEDRECSDVISEIDELMEEIDSAYACLGTGTGDISLKSGRSDDILT